MSGKQFSLDSHLDLVHSTVNNTSIRPYSEPDTALPLLEDNAEVEENDIKNGDDEEG